MSHVKPKADVVDVVAVVYRHYSNSACVVFFLTWLRDAVPLFMLSISCLVNGTVVTLDNP